MKFKINFNNNVEHRTLTYRSDEFSFDIEPNVTEINFDLVVNYLNLTVVDDNRIVQVLGYCPTGTWIKTKCNVPENNEGELILVDKLEAGLSYNIFDSEVPVYVNIETGWICLGDPKNKNVAVEFITNCVAVIKDGDLISLWLKPDSLPEV